MVVKIVSKAPNKHDFFPKFENTTFRDCYNTDKLLNDIREKDIDLYNHGCSFEKAYKYADILYTTSKPEYVCPYINEWLNYKKKSYTSNGEKCDKVQMWDNYIESLWIQLQNNADFTKNWCTRTTDAYACSNLSPYAIIFLVSFFVFAVVLSVFFLLKNLSTLKHRFHAFINKNERMQNHISDYDSQKILEYSENSRKNLLKEKINLAYHSTENY
ncbi:PIR protein [Plasmodium ovale]|uniref:PIR Superfamily Protein n=2 Tax=Plasmodium ovale TaxID=36330 RepID=A0A1A8XDP6_PLAOA|nr:PIR Superfamily Protein [Plasmodium ovale curtisi]SBT84732.1 PIR protein [Plasmodium ovale]